jgi:acetyltransferase-like isoleucine patch superfamily enzyme
MNPINKDSEAEIHPGACLGYRPLRNIETADVPPLVGKSLIMFSGAVIYNGTILGDNARLGHHAIIREQNIIGDDFCLWSNSVVDYGCRIGHRVKIHSNVYVAQFTILDDDVFLAPGVIIGNDPHPGCPFSLQCMRGPHICRGAKVGLNVTILPFVTIGEGSLIGAGSVVTGDIPAGVVAYGNPARPVKSVNELTCIVQPPLTDHPYPTPGK